MKTRRLTGFGARALLLLLAFSSVLLLLQPAGGQVATAPLALESAISVPIDVSADGELMLLFLPGLQGFELVNANTGEREIISSAPCTGYFASISPDKKYVCFKDFTDAGGRRLQRPVLYEIAQKKLVPLSDPVAAAGNPVGSSRGQIAYTVGGQLVVLNPDLSPCLRLDLGEVVNVLTFSPDGKRLAYSGASESIRWLEVDTGKRGALPFNSVHGYQPRFSPKGEALLARSSNGELTACQLASGRARNFGRVECATWLDEETVAFARKKVANYAVLETEVLTGKLSESSVATALTKKGDAAFALNGPVMAFAAEEGISVAETRTGRVWKKSEVRRPKAEVRNSEGEATPGIAVAPASKPEAAGVSPRNVVTNGTTVQLIGVPYIQQLYDSTDDFPGGGSCCNATATLMAIQYFNRLPPHPITCTRGGTHTSNYGYYISSIYGYGGFVFDIASADWGLTGYYGGFGYFLQDAGGSSLQHSIRLKEFIQYHSLTSATDDSVTGETGVTKARAEINANYPIVVLNDLTSAGHYITCIGYIQNQHTFIFNDPYGNKAIAYPGWAGAGAMYDWPGWNNGYPNLNGVWRYVYARGTVNANTNWGSYWDRNGATAGAGSASNGTWDSASTNWSSSASGNVATGPWYEQNAYFAAGSDAGGAYTVTVSGKQVVNGLFVQEGTVTFTGGQFYFRGMTTYYSNYVAAGCTAIFNTPFGGTGSPDKWGPGTAVYNGANTSSGYYSLNEGTLALGNNAALSTARLEVGDTSGANVVTLKSADTTAHTLANKLAFNAVNFNLGAGGDLIFTGPIDVGANSSAATVIAVSNLTTFSGVLTNTGGLGKTGPGTLVLSGGGANTYGSTSANGNTTVSGGILKLSKNAGVAAVPNGSLRVNAGGTLLLGAANQIGDGVPMSLGGGVFQTAGFSEQVGTLQLTANSQIDLGSGASVLAFAASSGTAWTGGTVLTITNWNGSVTGGGAERAVFGNNNAGLTAGQVSQIRFANPPGFPAGSYSATILSTGEVVPMTVAPRVTTQPTDRVAVAGDDVSLTVAAGGVPAPAYQWRCFGTNLPGATGATLTLNSIGLGQAGTYSAMVTNIAGTSYSSNAVLTVYPTAAPVLSGARCLPGGQFQLDLAGVPGYRYAILASTNLSNWSVVETTHSPFTFTDTNTAGCAYRFYRAQYVP